MRDYTSDMLALFLILSPPVVTGIAAAAYGASQNINGGTEIPIIYHAIHPVGLRQSNPLGLDQIRYRNLLSSNGSFDWK
jgi:hypothetical protein